MNVARNLGGTLGISSVQTMLAQRSQWHQARLVESLNPLNPNYVQGLDQTTRALNGAGQAGPGVSTEALAQIYAGLGRQSQMLAYIDVFHVLMLVVFGAIPLLLLMQGPKGGQAPGGAA